MRARFVIILVLLISITLPNSARATAQEPAPLFAANEIVPGELIVIMQKGESFNALSLPEQTRRAAKKRKGLSKLDAGVVNVPAGEESAYIAKLKKQKGVLTVEPNYKVHAQLIPDDTFYPLQYGPAAIQAESAWNTTIGSGVTIAIIDSGLDLSHPEFAGRIVAGYDFVNNDTIPQDECGHGTHATGIALATGNNTQGIAGIAWGANIMPLRVLDAGCGGSFADIAEALIWAADHGAQIINMSVGSASPSTLMENATYYAYSHGSAIFAAAGNSGLASVVYPAAYPWVMSVSAVNSTNARAGFSNYGAALDLMAPGVSIYSTTPFNASYNITFGTAPQYDFLSGTSMASPHAAGAAALLTSLPCFTTPDQIYQALIDSALDLGAVGWDNLTGHGLIQIADAMLLCPPLTPPPATFTTQYDLVSSSSCTALVQYNWINGVTQQVSPGGGSYTSLALPFNFDYAGVSYASINAHANGFISLGNNNTNLITEGNYRDNFALPGIALPNNFLAPFWDDLKDIGGAGVGIYTTTLGIAPAREFVIEYRGFQRSGAPGSSLNFEAVLFEGSNEILYQYKTLSGINADGGSATVGLEYGNGLGGLQYSYNQNGALKSGLALLFSPFTSGAATLPSSVCAGMTRSRSFTPAESVECTTSAAQFDVDIFQGELAYSSILKIQQLTSAPIIPAPYLDLKHYADIQLRYDPPAISLVPMPLVQVCYQYTAQDVLVAGGHPENLFIAAHDVSTNVWTPLTTTVDAPNSRLLAIAPHFSFYGVGTLAPARSSSSGGGLGMPVTGSPISANLAEWLFFVGVIFLSHRIWLSKKAKQ